MSLTEVEKHLIHGLQVFGVSKGISAVIFMTLQSEEQRWAMIHYMADNRDATENELLEQAREIGSAT